MVICVNAEQLNYLSGKPFCNLRPLQDSRIIQTNLNQVKWCSINSLGNRIYTWKCWHACVAGISGNAYDNCTKWNSSSKNGYTVKCELTTTWQQWPSLLFFVLTLARLQYYWPLFRIPFVLRFDCNFFV